MVQLRFEIDTTKVAVAPAVLVHREDGPGGVTLYFLTTEHLLHPPALAAARSEWPLALAQSADGGTVVAGPRIGAFP